MTQRFDSPVSLRRRRLVSALRVAALPGAAVIDRHVDVAPLWTDTFSAALTHGA